MDNVFEALRHACQILTTLSTDDLILVYDPLH